MRTTIQQLADNYVKLVRWSDEDSCFVGSIPDLCGDCCHGDTPGEVYDQLVEIAEDLVATAQRDGLTLPIVRTKVMMEMAS